MAKGAGGGGRAARSIGTAPTATGITGGTEPPIGPQWPGSNRAAERETLEAQASKLQRSLSDRQRELRGAEYELRETNKVIAAERGKYRRGVRDVRLSAIPAAEKKAYLARRKAEHQREIASLLEVADGNRQRIPQLKADIAEIQERFNEVKSRF